MNSELVQLLFYAGFAVLGWWLRHQGILGPKPVSVSPPAAPTPIDHKVVLDLLKAMLDRLGHPPSTAAPASSNTGTGTTITVPFEVAATPKVPASGT